MCQLGRGGSTVCNVRARNEMQPRRECGVRLLLGLYVQVPNSAVEVRSLCSRKRRGAQDVATISCRSREHSGRKAMISRLVWGVQAAGCLGTWNRGQRGCCARIVTCRANCAEDPGVNRKKCHSQNGKWAALAPQLNLRASLPCTLRGWCVMSVIATRPPSVCCSPRSMEPLWNLPFPAQFHS